MRIILLFIVAAFVLSQQGIVVSKTNGDPCDIYLSNRTVLKNAEIFNVDDSLVSVSKEGKLIDFQVDKVNKIVYKHSGFWIGASIGAGGSVGFWTLYGALLGSEGAGIGMMVGWYLAIPTALLSGLIAELAVQDEVYFLKKANNRAKVKKIKMILRKHL